MKHITDCFSKELVKICQKSYAADKWQLAVHDYLGEPINRHVQLGSFEKGKMVLIVDDPLWASELRVRLPHLRDHIRLELRCYSLMFIQIKIQPGFFKAG